MPDRTRAPVRSPVREAAVILGIDPGPTESGWVILDGDRIDSCGVNTTPEVVDLCRGWFHTLAIEKIVSYGMAVGESVFETVFWTGRMVEASYTQDVHRIPRLDVKLHLCHDSRAKDANIRQALIDKLGPPGTKANPGPTYNVKSHAWAALAVAVTAAETRINA